MENTSMHEQLPLSSYTDMATAFWANLYLLSFQAMNRAALTYLTLIAGSCAGTLKAARAYYEHDKSR